MKGEEELKNILENLNLDYEETEVDVSDELKDSEKFKAFNSFYRKADLQFTAFEGENPEFNAIGVSLVLDDIFSFEETEALKEVLEDIKTLADKISSHRKSSKVKE